MSEHKAESLLGHVGFILANLQEKVQNESLTRPFNSHFNCEIHVADKL